MKYLLWLGLVFRLPSSLIVYFVLDAAAFQFVAFFVLCPAFWIARLDKVVVLPFGIVDWVVVVPGL